MKKIALMTGASSGFDAATANLLLPDATLNGYAALRETVSRRVQQAMASAEGPKLRYTAGALARRLRWLRWWAAAGLLEAGLRRDLSLA